MTSDQAYRKLLVQYAPGPIRSAKEYRRALAQLEELMVPRADEAHSRLIELLATLVAQYESRQLPNPQVAPAQMLAHLLDSKQIKPAQVAKTTGIPPATISNVLAGRRGISKANARKLADFFGVSPLVLLDVSTGEPETVRITNPSRRRPKSPHAENRAG